jgi:RNA polymerase sigma-70 factor (ECF subfamily)
MGSTRKSLLIRARNGDEEAWEDLCVIYRPLIVGWLRRQGVASGDIDDLVQEILLKVVRNLPSFKHSGRRGAFRSWLRTIAHNNCCDYWKAPARHAVMPAGDGAAALEQLEDPDSALNRSWDEEHDRYVLRCLLDLMKLEFEPPTMRAFLRVTLEGATTAQAAAEAGVSVDAIYAGRSRILRRLRELAGGLLDELP